MGASQAEVDAILDRHYAAEVAGSLEDTLSTFTDGSEHGVVGRPENPLRGKADVRRFPAGLFEDIAHHRFALVRRFSGADFVVDEAVVEGKAIGTRFGIPGRGRPVCFRLQHVFGYETGVSPRENAWLDLAALHGQVG